MNGTSEQSQRAKCRSLRSVPLFSLLSLDELETVERLFVRRHFAKDQIVLFEEDNCNCMYLVYSGKVRVVKQNEAGKEQIITIHRKNDFFGEMSLLDGRTAPATVIAHEDSVIGFLTKTDFDRHLMSNEKIRARLIDLLCSRLRDAWEMIKILSFNNENAEHRLLTVLDRLQELHGIRDDRGTIISVKFTHQQLASYASVTRETVSRVLKRMEKARVIGVLEDKSILLTPLFYKQKEAEITRVYGSY